jgi:hypothetical protein
MTKVIAGSRAIASMQKSRTWGRSVLSSVFRDSQHPLLRSHRHHSLNSVTATARSSSRQRRSRYLSAHPLVAVVLAIGMISLGGGQSAFATAGDISTVAGGPGAGSPTNVAQCASGIATDSSGDIYTSDHCQQVVREYDPTTGVESIAAGIGGPNDGGFSGDGGSPTAAQVSSPEGLAIDGSGNLIIADSGNNRIRVVASSTATFYGVAMTTGDIYTVAGGGNSTSSNVPATTAQLSGPTGVTLDGNGNLILTDDGDNLVRIVAGSTATFYGTSMTEGDIYTLAGGGSNVCPSGSATVQLSSPSGITVDASGNLIISDSGHNCVVVVPESTGTFYGISMTVGDIYTVAGTGTPGFSGDGSAATSAEIHTPDGVRVDGHGNLLFADSGNNRIRAVADSTATFYGVAMTAGDIYTVAGSGVSLGDGGVATSAQLQGPSDVAVDSSGNLIIADGGDRRVRLVAESAGTFYDIPGTTVTGDIYTIEGNGTIYFSGDGGSATSAEFDVARGISIDSSGDELITDSGNNVVRMVPATSGTYYGVAMTAGDVYTVAGNGTGGDSGLTGPATSAELADPGGAAVDANGNLVIADSNNCRILVVAGSTGTFYQEPMTDGDVYSVAGVPGFCGNSTSGIAATNSSAYIEVSQSVAIDGNGNVVFADTGACFIKVLAEKTATMYGTSMTKGHLYDVAGDVSGFAITCGNSTTGTLGTSAELTDPIGVAVDISSGNLAITEGSENRIKVLAETTGTFYGISMTKKHLYDVAGNGTPGYSGDGATSTSAEIDGPSGVAVDSSGNIAFSDQSNDRVRVVANATGTFFGVSMTAGDINTVAGDGTFGFTGDGGLATSAELYYPQGVAVDSSGNLFIDDSGNDRFREVLG